MAHTGSGEAAATITTYEDGPLLVRGDFVLRTSAGETIDPGRATVALCRCGKSAIRPFCDGTHRAIGFRAGAEPDRGPDGRGDRRPGSPDPA
ncbi:hypothetical protein GCM10027290_04040 [Micromonospora sonneratiae]|uniref:CDGSH iron-sulfur domain-containing protein n=1 Tax=Micromonospora sonneratiae TaxID=1184706 RepID=A0ABW3YKX4_9ACTN